METDLTDVKEYWRDFDREGAWLSQFEEIFGLTTIDTDEENDDVEDVT